MLNSNIRCIEILMRLLNILQFYMLNSNIRCIEMRAGATEPAKPSSWIVTLDVLKYACPPSFLRTALVE